MSPRLVDEDVMAMADPANIHTRAHSDVSVLMLAQEVLWHRQRERYVQELSEKEQPIKLIVIPRPEDI